MLKILVPVKRVVDPYVKIHVRKDNTGVDTQNLKMTLNPFDAISVEEAVRMQEKGLASEIVVVTISQDPSIETLRYALALGADRAIMINTSTPLEPFNVAKCLSIVAKNEKPDLILMGKQAIDDDSNQVGQMLAAYLGWPQACFASKITVQDNEKLLVEREIDGGIETLALTLPGIVTTDLRLNEPRYPAIPNIMKAKRKELIEIPVDVLIANQINPLTLQPIEINERVKTLSVTPPKVRSAGKRVSSVTELVSCLKNEAKVLS